jgi:hypothetical protein
VGIGTVTSGLSASDGLGFGTGVTPDAMAGWSFIAPAGTTIGAAELVRDFYKRGDDTWQLFVSDQTGSRVPGQNCTIDPAIEYQCEITGTLQLGNLNDTALSVGVLCTAGSCVNGALAHDVRADLNSAVVTLADPTPPTAPGAGGVLSQPAWHSGTGGLNISSTDAVGIGQVQVRRADGGVLASATLPCDYTYPVPCHQAMAAPVQIDTTQLPDGIDPVTLTATDAAQSATTSTINLMIANHAPPAPRLTGAPSGPTAQPSAMITAQMPSAAVPITTLDWMLCASTCGTPTPLPVPAGASTVSFKVTVPKDGDYTIAAYAVDAAGHRSALASQQFDVDRSSPAGGGSGAGQTGSTNGGAGLSQTLPGGPTAKLTLPLVVGSAGVRLRLTLRRRAHRRLELAVRTSPGRPGRLLVDLTFAGHRPTIRRLTLRRGAASVTVPTPAGATRLTVVLTGLGARATDHVRLTTAST